MVKQIKKLLLCVIYQSPQLTTIYSREVQHAAEYAISQHLHRVMTQVGHRMNRALLMDDIDEYCYYCVYVDTKLLLLCLC